MKIGFIGTGVMGSSMIKNLLAANHQVNVYNRTIAKALPLIEFKADVFNNIADCVKDVDLVITIVGYPKDVEEVYQEVFKNIKQNTICIDMTTSSPSLAIELFNMAKSINCDILDAPVSGGDNGAVNGTLSIMVGGNLETFNKTLPILKCMGSNITYIGKAGSGQHTKMANQIAIAGCIAGVCEAMSYSEKMDLDTSKVLEAISKGAAGSWQMSNTAVRILEKDFEPGFYIKHFIKDMNIAKDELKNIDINFEVLNTVLDIYNHLSDEGLENEATSSLYKYYSNK